MLKRLLLCFVSLMVLSGCASQQDSIDAISEYYAGLDALTLEASVTTNSGAVVCYDILFTRNEEGDKVTILSPESLAGITATIYSDKAQVVYQDVAVETLLPGISGYVPADAVSGIIKDLSQSTPDGFGESEAAGRDAITVTFLDEYEGMAAEKTLWLDKETMSLLKGEFYLDGTMIMELNVKSFVA